MFDVVYCRTVDLSSALENVFSVPISTLGSSFGYAFLGVFLCIIKMEASVAPFTLNIANSNRYIFNHLRSTWIDVQISIESFSLGL